MVAGCSALFMALRSVRYVRLCACGGAVFRTTVAEYFDKAARPVKWRPSAGMLCEAMFMRLPEGASPGAFIHATSERRSGHPPLSDDFLQGVDQRLALHIGTDRDAQMLINARQLEVADNDLALAQVCRERGRIVLRVAGKDEIGG